MNAQTATQTQTQTQQIEIDALPNELDSPRSKLVYLSLTVNGGSTPTALKEELGIPKLTLFSVLDTLTGHGLVERDGDVYAPA